MACVVYGKTSKKSLQKTAIVKIDIKTRQVGFFKKNPIERSAATTAAADDADVSQ